MLLAFADVNVISRLVFALHVCPHPLLTKKPPCRPMSYLRCRFLGEEQPNNRKYLAFVSDILGSLAPDVPPTVRSTTGRRAVVGRHNATRVHVMLSAITTVGRKPLNRSHVLGMFYPVCRRFQFMRNDCRSLRWTMRRCWDTLHWKSRYRTVNCAPSGCTSVRNVAVD